MRNARVHVLLAAAMLLAVACGAETERDSEPASTSTAAAPASASGYVESFEVVWATVNEEFYDPEFGGVDWQAAHDRYLPLVAAADSDEAFVDVTNSMLFELGVSHLGVAPPDEPEQLEPVLTAEGELGIDVRLLDGEWVITSVEPGSPAADAGMRAGCVLQSVAGESVSQIAASHPPLPPFHERGERSAQIMAVRAHLHGEPGAVTTIRYRDTADQPRQLELTFVRRESSSEIVPGVPRAYTSMEVDRLEGGIGYIAFNAFVPGLLTPLLDAIDEMQDTPGLIVDLRGNHGGVFPVRKGLVDRLVDEPVHLWTYQGRLGIESIYVEPTETTYHGPMVVLVDVLSMSSAEEFSGGLQAIGRAVVVGERTAGRVLAAEITELPIGALMMYPVAESVVADGTVLEAHGVVPDIPVAVDREDLLAGVDAPLEAAVEYLQSSLAGASA